MIKYLLLFCMLLLLPEKMHAEKRALGIGSPALDYVHLVDDALLKNLSLTKGGWKEADSFFFWGVLAKVAKETPFLIHSGGSALNTMRGLASLGIKTSITGHLGLDERGNELLGLLEKAHITPLCTRNEAPTSLIACLVTPDGSHSFCSYTEGEKTMSFQDLKPSHFHGVDLVHIEGYRLINDLYVETAMKMGKKADALISFTLSHPSFGERYRNRILGFLNEYVDMVFLKCEEAFALTRLPPALGCQFLNNYCNICVIMEEGAGCWVGSSGEIQYYPLGETKIVDLTGGEDFFISGFLYGILKEAPLSQCAQFGNLLKSVALGELGSIIPEDKWPSLKENFWGE